MTLSLRTVLLSSWVMLPVVATAQPAVDSKFGACAVEQDDAKRLACFDAIAKAKPLAAVPGAATAAATPATNTPEPPYKIIRSAEGTLWGAGEWAVIHEKDSLTDKPRVDMLNEGETEFGSTNSKPILSVRCFNQKLDVMVNSGAFIGSRDTFRTTFRFDTAAPQTQSWVISTTGKAVFSPAPAAFMAQMHGASRLITEVVDFNGRRYRSSFDITGIKDAAKEIAACWRPAAPPPAKPAAAAAPVPAPKPPRA